MISISKTKSFLLKVLGTGLVLIPIVFNNNHVRIFSTPKTFFVLVISEIIIFTWAYLFCLKKKFLPKINILVTIITLLILSLTLSSIFGLSPNMSFWSTLDRGTGLITLIHLGLVTFAIGSILEKEDLKKLFKFAAYGSLVVCLSVILGQDGFNILGSKFLLAAHGSGVFGNSTFALIYLSYPIFWTLYLVFNSDNKKEKTIFSAILALVLLCPFFINWHNIFTGGINILSFVGSARAGSLAILLSLVLFAALFLISRSRVYLKIVGGLLILATLVLSIIFFVQIKTPRTFVHEKFIEEASGSRFIFWDVASRAIKDRPILGYGVDNYYFVFQKYFNPDIYLPVNGKEILTDRPHNVFYEMAVDGGFVALGLYIGLFLGSWFLLIRHVVRKKDDWLMGGVLGLPLFAVLFQNQFAFDLSSTYFFLFVNLGFILVLTREEKNNLDPQNRIKGKPSLKALFIILALAGVTFFAVLPSSKSKMFVRMFNATVEDRTSLYRKTERISPVGKIYDFTYAADKIYQEYAKYLPTAKLSPEEKSLVIKEILEMRQELTEVSSTNENAYKTFLLLAEVDNLLYQTDPDVSHKSDYFKEAIIYGEKCLNISDNNQQGYWVLMQTYALSGEIDKSISYARSALALSPNVIESNNYLIEVLKIKGNKKEIDEAIRVRDEILKTSI